MAATHPLHWGRQGGSFCPPTPDPGGSYAKHLPLGVSHAVPLEIPLAGVMQNHDQLLAATHPLHTGVGKVAAEPTHPDANFANCLPLLVPIVCVTLKHSCKGMISCWQPPSSHCGAGVVGESHGQWSVAISHPSQWYSYATCSTALAGGTLKARYQLFSASHQQPLWGSRHCRHQNSPWLSTGSPLAVIQYDHSYQSLTKDSDKDKCA